MNPIMAWGPDDNVDNALSAFSGRVSGAAGRGGGRGRGGWQGWVVVVEAEDLQLDAMRIPCLLCACCHGLVL